MSTQVQIRRGNTTQTGAFTGVVAEVTVDTDKKTLVVHDGTTSGGFPLALESSLTSNATFSQAAFTQANAAFLQANTPSHTANSQVNFVGESGVVVLANSITKTITFAGTPGAQGLTVDYGFVYDSINYSIDYGTL